MSAAAVSARQRRSRDEPALALRGTVPFTQGLVFADTGANHDWCKGATIPLASSSKQRQSDRPGGVR